MIEEMLLCYRDGCQCACVSVFFASSSIRDVKPELLQLLLSFLRVRPTTVVVCVWLYLNGAASCFPPRQTLPHTRTIFTHTLIRSIFFRLLDCICIFFVLQRTALVSAAASHRQQSLSCVRKGDGCCINSREESGAFYGGVSGWKSRGCGQCVARKNCGSC
jgi:hypothetical protein